MHPYLLELRADHARFLRLLALLDHQLDVLEAGGMPDYRMAYQLIDYLGEQPDLLHHPREDLLYQRVAYAHGDLSALVARLGAEHGALRRLSHDFKTLLYRAGWLEETEVLATGKRYAGLLRAHIACEETELYPVADAVLEDEDWLRLAALAPVGRDPLAERRAAVRFDALRTANLIH